MQSVHLSIFILVINQLTYLLTPWCRVLLEKLTGLQLVKKFPAFHRTRRFITALTSLRHLSLSWASPIQSIYPQPTSWRSSLILSTHLRLGLPSGLLPSGYPTKILYTSLSSPIRATCPAHLILLHFITLTILGEEYRSFSSSLCSLLHSPVTSSLLGPNILNTIFSNTLSFLSSLNVSDQVSHPYKTTGKIIVLYILIFKFLDSNLQLDAQHFCFTISSHRTATYRCDDTRGCIIQFWPPDNEHMCSKHVEAWNKLIVKQKFCASSWLITEIKKCTL